MRTLWLLLLSIAWICPCVHGQSFEPVTDTLARYGITHTPEAGEYPGDSAVTVLSLQEYDQESSRHDRITHRIVKVLKESALQERSFVVGCLSSCTIQARTIKANGKIINIPSRDIIRSEQYTEYAAPLTLIQFAMPGVEPGDLIEYITRVRYPFPFLADDFRFDEPYPAMKAVFILVHPPDYSYQYKQYLPPGAKPPTMFQDRVNQMSAQYFRTTYVFENVPAAHRVPYTTNESAEQPGVRLMIAVMNGAAVHDYKDWQGYGKLVGKGFRVAGLVVGPIKDFIRGKMDSSADPATIVKSVYEGIDKKITVHDRHYLLPGISGRTVEEVWKEGAGTPEDFALLLSTCFKDLKWGVDLILVNSYRKPDADLANIFPPDLDLLFVRVRTPAGDFWLDCNSNGNSVDVLPPAAVNRTAIVIPVMFDFQKMELPANKETVGVRGETASRMELDISGDAEAWNTNFRWNLMGAEATELFQVRRVDGQDEMDKAINDLVRSRLGGEVVTFSHRIVGNGIELSGKTKMPRRRYSEELELMQNEFWDSGFDLTPSLLKGRTDSLLLPLNGEISAVYRIHIENGLKFALPEPADIECDPVRYVISVSKQPGLLQIQTNLKIRDIRIEKAKFAQMTRFLESYSQNWYWRVLLSRSTLESTILPVRKIQIIPYIENKTYIRQAVSNIPAATRVQITGKLNQARLFLVVKNLTVEAVDRCEFTIQYKSADIEDQEQKQPDCTIAGKGVAYFSFPVTEIYSLAEITLRLSQKGVWYDSGPFVVEAGGP